MSVLTSRPEDFYYEYIKSVQQQRLQQKEIIVSGLSMFYNTI